MKLKKCVSLVLAAVLTASMLLTGCGKKEEPQDTTQTTKGTDAGSMTNTQETEPQLNEEQVLNMIFLKPTTLDVNDVRNASEFQLLSQVQEGLFRIFSDENGNDVVTNAGCESYEVSEDNLTYTFKLREYYWNDGVKVTAQHYVDSILRLLSPDEAFSYAFMGYDILNGEAYFDGQVSAEEVGVKALDEKTLEIKLQQVTPYFLKKIAMVCFYPVRLDVIEAGSEQWATEFTEQVYCGPFVISEWVKDHSCVLTKNPTYWDAENVHLEKVNMTTVDEKSTQALLFNQKELDVVEGTTDYIKKWNDEAAAGNIQAINTISPNVNYVIFNQHTGGVSGLMNNAKIRLALSLAFDRQEYLDLVYERHQVSYGLIPPGLMVGDVEFRSEVEEPLKAVAAQYDTMDKVKALFQEGLAEEGRDTDLSKVKLVYLTYGETAENKIQQEYFRQTWEKNLGIQIEVSVQPDSTLFVTERNANNYDLLNNGWNGDYSDPMTFIDMWLTGSGYAKFFGGYHSEKFDALYEELKGETDNQKRLELYAEMERILVAEEAGMGPTYYSDKKIYIQNYVHDVSCTMFGPIYEFSRAYISKK